MNVREHFARQLDVSCETIERLDVYVALLKKWSRAINLFGPTDDDELWHRHLYDSAQIVKHLKSIPDSWIDLGSGAGFPGLVCAILLSASAPKLKIELVDSDQRKAAFLRETARQTSTPVKVTAARCDEIDARPYRIITARALAPLPRLLRWAAPFCGDDTVLLLHKGRGAIDELTHARTEWHTDADILPSLTDPDAAILRITNLQRLP